jgi:hypothetical protein
MAPEGLLPYHESQQLKPVLNQMNQFHTLTPCLCKINFKLVSYLGLDLSSCLFPSGLPTKFWIILSPSPSRSCHFPQFDKPNNIWINAQTVELLIMHSSPYFC